MHENLLRHLQKLARRRHNRRFFLSFAVSAMLPLAVVVLISVTRDDWDRAGVLAALVATSLPWLATLVWRATRHSSPSEVVRWVEEAHPTLQQRLYTALEHPSTPDSNPYQEFFRERLLSEIWHHARRNDQWQVVVGRNGSGWLAIGGCLGLVTAGGIAHQVWQATNWAPTLVVVDADPVHLATSTFALVVEPGDAEVEFGTNWTVSATLQGAWSDVPVELHRRSSQGQVDVIRLQRSLEDPVFAARVEGVRTPFTYRVRAGDVESPEYSVNVFAWPELTQADARLEYPSYTQQAARETKNTRRVSAVEGTQIAWHLQFNKQLQRVWLEEDQGSTVEAQSLADNPSLWKIALKPAQTTKWRVRVTDAEGRALRSPTELMMQILPNQPPQWKILSNLDAPVSPLEEVSVQGEVSDDFGVVRTGLRFGLTGQTEQEATWAVTGNALRRVGVSESVELEVLKAAPDQLLSLALWAEDVGPDGVVRRTWSDLFVMEVRAFEEIFRQGAAPAGGSQETQGAAGGGGPAEALLDLQKQILVGTWNVSRPRRDSKAVGTRDEQLQTLVNSQQQALDQVEADGGRNGTPNSLPQGDELETSMRRSRDLLEQSRQVVEGPEGARLLDEAIAAQQVALRELVARRAKEHDVVRSRASSRSQQANSARQQQMLRELELDEDENRYETPQQAQSAAQDRAESELQDEQRQILNRLRDLARRQTEMNRALADLPAPTEGDAQDDATRQEQLRRLRDSQQELLEDADELGQRLEHGSQESRWEEARQRMADARERMQQANEAAERGQTSEGLAAGTRAAEQLEQLADEVRQQTASQFQNQLREMQDSAERLVSEQQSLQQTSSLTSDSTPGLRGTSASGEPTRVSDRLAAQRERLELLYEKIKETIEQAESTEPLLARNLFETLQAAENARIEEHLRDGQNQAERGAPESAREAIVAADEGLKTLQSSLNESGRQVLGNDLDTWRRIADELGQINRALREAAPESTDAARRVADESKSSEENEDTEGERLDEAGEDANRADAEPARLAGAATEGDPERDPEGDRPAASANATNETETGPEVARQPRPETQSPEGPGNAASGTPSSSSTARGPLSGGNRNPGVDLVAGPNSEEWTDRIRNIEELLGEGELRDQVAQVRERIRGMRRDLRRHGSPPQWEAIEQWVVSPLRDIEKRAQQEVSDRSGQRMATGPVDRDPVPAPFVRRVQRYYERLGSGRE